MPDRKQFDQPDEENVVEFPNGEPKPVTPRDDIGGRAGSPPPRPASETSSGQSTDSRRFDSGQYLGRPPPVGAPPRMSGAPPSSGPGADTAAATPQPEPFVTEPTPNRIWTVTEDDVQRARLGGDDATNTATDPLAGVKIDTRRGNYIFTFGRSGSGKTVLQSSLVRYLQTSRHFELQKPTAFTGELANDGFANDTYIEWRDGWRENILPERTQKGKPSEFRFKVAPHARPNLPLEFGFFEVAGEDFEKTRRTKGGVPSLQPSIKRFLQNPNCTFQFLFVCNGMRLESDDTLFADFLNYLRNQISERFWESSHICIVIANPFAALVNLKNQKPEFDHLQELDINAFLETFLKLTYAELESWKKPFGAAQFHIGTVSPHPSIKDRKVIDSWDQTDSQLLFELIYENFTGKTVQPQPTETAIGKFLAWLRGR